MESSLGPGKSLEINQMVATFLTHCTRFWPLYVLSLFTVSDYCSVYLQLSFETCHCYIQKVINGHMCVTV